MSLIKKTTASIALVALASGLFVSGTSAYSSSELEAANKLATAGIIRPQSNPANYELDREVLRQEIAGVTLWLAKIQKTSTCTNMFRDVSATNPNTWACYTVEALAKADLIAKNKYFRPEANITKAESIGMVVKAIYGDEYEYNPALVTTWQQQVVDFAISKGIVSRFTNYDTPATRGFIFEAAARALGDPKDAVCKILGECGDSTKEPTKPTKPTENNNVRPDGNLEVELSPLSPSNGSVPALSDRAELLAFNVTAGKTDVTLRRASFKFTGLGNPDIVTKMAIYSNDVKLTKGNDKSFNSRGNVDLSFDRDIVVKAGETKTLFVTATLDPSKLDAKKGQNVYNQTVRVELTNLESSATVRGAELSGPTLIPTATYNKGTADVRTTSASGRLYIGEDDVLYNFSVKEDSRREGLVVKSATFSEATGNTADLDNLADLRLVAGGKEIKADFTYQKSKIVATFEEKVNAWERVNFILRGKATDDLNDTLALELTDIYAIGANTGIAVNSEIKNADVATKTIEGTAVNFSFNRDTNEVSSDTTDVKIGDLVFVTTSNYTAKLQIKVSGTAADKTKYDDLSIDSEEVSSTDTANVYTLDSVYLNKGTTKLPLTLDITDKALNAETLKFTVKVVSLEEDTLGEKVDNLNKVLNNSELSKEVTVRQAAFKLTAEKANITKVVPKGNQEVVLYKGRIDLTGGEDITLDSLVFDKTSTSVDLLDYVSGATLNIGGKTFNGDVNDDNINFSSIYAKIQKNSKSVGILLTATLKDKEISAEKTLEIVPNESKISVSADNAKNVSAKVITQDFTGLSQNASTQVKLEEQTTLKVSDVTNELRDDVLAGSNGAEIGAFKLKDTNSDIYFNSFEVKAEVSWTNTLASALSNIRLVDWSTIIADGGYVSGEYVRFDNFTLPQSGRDRTLKIVADIASIDTAGGETASYVGKVEFKQVKIDTSDSSFESDETEATIASEPVNIVPAIVTYAATEKFNTNGDNEAVIKVTVDSGNNQLNKLTLKQLNFNKSVDPASVKVNGDTVDVSASQDLELNKEITGLKTFEVSILLNGSSSEGAVILKKLKLQAKIDTTDVDFEAGNSDVSLGSYAQ